MSQLGVCGSNPILSVSLVDGAPPSRAEKLAVACRSGQTPFPIDRVWARCWSSRARRSRSSGSWANALSMALSSDGA